MNIAKKTKVLFCTVLLAISLPVMAMNLQQAMSALGNAKEQGLIGEQLNGYLGQVQQDANAAEIVRLINDARRAEYQKMANQNNISLNDVQAMAGKKAIERTQAGHYIQLDGKWQKKN